MAHRAVIRRRDLVTAIAALGVLLPGSFLPKKALAGGASAPPAPFPQPLITLSNQRLYRATNGQFNNTAGSGNTNCTLWNLEDIPAYVRMILHNATTSSWTADGIAVALSGTVNDGTNPTNAIGAADTTLWQSGTFNNGGSFSYTPFNQAAGSIANLTVPANPYTSFPGGRPSLTASDWIGPIPPLSRTDGGVGALLMTRLFSNSPAQLISLASGIAVAGRAGQSSYKSGNFTTAGNYSISAPNSLTGWSTSYAIEYIGQSLGSTVLGVGDSIMAGFNAEGLIDPFVYKACALVSTPTLPVSFANQGFSGRATADFYADAITDIINHEPNIVVTQMYSSNDANTQAAADAAFNGGLELIWECRRRGIYVIACTPAPTDGPGGQPSAYEPLRAQAVTRIKALSNRVGLPILDLNGILGTGASPNAYKPGYGEGDNVHPSELGRTVVASQLAPMIKMALGV